MHSGKIVLDNDSSKSIRDHLGVSVVQMYSVPHRDSRCFERNSQQNMFGSVGLAVGIALLQLPWKVVGIMLAGPASYYKQQQEQLTSTFGSAFGTAPHITFCWY